MNITKIISSVFFIPRAKIIASYHHSALEIQRDQLNRLVSYAKNTEIGKQYDFANIKKYGDFSKKVPLHSYEDIFPSIKRMMDGEKNVLWPSTVRWFAKSSGTTNDKSKFIPVSKEGLIHCHYAGGRDCIALYLRNNPQSRIFSGKGLILGGSLKKSDFSKRYLSGDLSAVMIKNMPFLANHVRVPCKKIALMDEWEAKLEAICNSVIDKNVTNLSGVPSWFLVLIKKILTKTGKSYLTDIWPNLEVFFHGGISFEPYVEQYKTLIPSPDMHYMETYNASEGFFGIQNDPDDPSMLLMTDYGIFYEFIPLEQLNRPDPEIVSLEGVELNRNYATVISTNSGLWRYIIGDTIKFTSKNPYKFLITGRTKHFINAFGEELMVHNADKAMVKACRQTDAVIRDYTAAPVYMSSESNGCHQWIIEFERKPDSINYFTECLDSALKEANSDYEAKRYKNMTLSMPKIVIARENLFHDWLEEKNKLGGQHKVPRLSNDRRYIDELLNLNSE
ncbi:MAG: GH3 auxin-responsive promoter family protein [Candidatus Azobacteroides sp.]|nr:GH3 auxin-responsive promoter family protein [Candidatus Azobacteroides sp.]